MGLTKELKKDKLNVKIYDTRDEMGKAASADVAEAIKELLREKDEINMIFAAAPSQNDMLYHLCERDDICWERINAFHIPDLIYEMDPMYHFADARDEYLLEVPYAAIEKYAPSIYKQISEQAPAAWAYSYYEGKNYGMPNLNYSHVENVVSGYRGDWLEKLGMDAPDTLDELHDVLYAFVHNDPDGNGKDDTYGYAPLSTYYPYFFTEFFGAYGILPFDWQEVDGEIVYGGLRPEVETVLQLLADWNKEGLIYPAFIESDRSQKVLFTQGHAGYITSVGYQDRSSSTSTISTILSLNPDATIVYNDLVTGPDGISGYRGWGFPAHTVGFGNNGEDSAQKAVRLLKMFESMYTDEELLKEIRFGKEGELYTVNPENTTAQFMYEATENYKEGSQRRRAGYEFNYSGATFWSPIAPSKAFYEGAQSEAYKTWKKQYEEPYSILTDVFYKVDIVPSAPTYIADIQNGQQALMARVITGEVPADQYIEEFTKIWEASSGPTLLAEAQEQQKITEEIYKKIGIAQ